MQAKCTSTKERPMASPAKLPAPFLASVVPNTTSTNTNVNTISASRAPVTETPSWQALAPVPLTPELEVSTQRTAEPKIAPIT